MHRSASALIINENVPLAGFTTIGVGGAARYLARASREEHVVEAIGFARARGCPFFILGGGSNILVSDDGYQGLVLKIEIPGIEHEESGNRDRVSAGAGVEWDAFVRYCVMHQLAGIEGLSGIPGTAGGIPIQNAGAYGQEAGGAITGVRVWHRASGGIVDLDNSDCRFAYRSSVFTMSPPSEYVVLRVQFDLRADGVSTIYYPDIERLLAGAGFPYSVGSVREAVLKIRRSKGMIVRDGDPDSRSAGSFFKNPLFDPDSFAQLEASVRSQGLLEASEAMPRFIMPEGSVKVPAAWLIEKAGFPRGYSLGRVGISGKHALAIINRGGATAENVIDLSRRIRNRVMELFEVGLEPEPVFVGFQEDPLGSHGKFVLNPNVLGA
ncbi:MAG TPA: UDP-N-acetylmuramate dehydrogenase [Acidobacteriota bacterium]|nr:UDP-N-acetylmuramate dehydrogenase [Acidobacteriota bacterium]